MRHRVAGKKLNRTSSHRKALAMNLMRAFLIEWQGKGHIVTTRSKAKFIQPKIEKLISLSRNKTVHNVRRAMALIGDKDVVQVLFDEIGPYYSERPGGYTRVLRLVKPRLGDASVRAYLGYVREDDEYPEGDCRAKHAVESAAAVEAVVSEEAASEEADGAGSDEIASDDGEVQGAAAADSAAADESDSAEVETAAGEQSGAQEAVSEAQEDSESSEESTEESAEESDEASKQAEAEVEDSSTSEQEEETPPEKD
ncbi:MAG TPA: 50S ribosomal protein L17, partial [Planctomycetes bacterium]|nr:50S ribosomal protein L17 [Planctomycetota bacterium]